MDLLDQYQRYRLLFRTPTPDVREKLERSDEFIRSWLDRPGGDHSIPSSIDGVSPINVTRSTTGPPALDNAANGLASGPSC